MLVIKTLKGILKQIYLGDLMGLKGALFQNPPIRFEK